MRIKELGLYRTMKFNFVPYYTDGNGRDRYIAFNNGGFFQSKNSNKDDIKRTGTSFDTKISYKSVSPYIKAPNFHYHSDGNGRDSYIVTNGGGLYYDSKPLNSYKLTDFLRTNDFGSVYTKPGKVWMSKAHSKYNKFLKSKEKEIINRLYESEKKFFIKNKKVEKDHSFNEPEKEEKYKTLQTEETKLPRLNRRYFNTLDNEKEDMNEQEKEISKSLFNERKKKLLRKNITINQDELLLERLSKINNFDASNNIKKKNKSFNQAYFHLRNKNYNSKLI